MEVFKFGDRVRHPRWGVGTVQRPTTHTAKGYAYVAFQDHGQTIRIRVRESFLTKEGDNASSSL